MTPEQYERARTLFLKALDQEVSKRVEFVRQECSDDAILAEVESLLANEANEDTFLHTPALGKSFAVNGPEAWASSGKTPRPERIGQYRILDVLGEGGMGVVYRAEQENPRRTVALKVIRPGVESRELLKRFTHETRVLGWLKHPGIAQIFEAGTADAGHGSQPFFAMELVEGKPVTEYADEQGLGENERLELVVRICQALHHAHQKGVIHRDLKPANILVDDLGQPKILDFGVSRVSDGGLQATTMRTNAGEMIGTLAYMSPEQVSADSRELDTRSDVYSVGVICYELLTKRVPIELAGLTIPAAARAIVEQSPSALGKHDRSLRGDVETIVGKALEKDKNQRYQSASDFAADIERYLSDEPIMARPATTVYQLRKFARRNKALVVSITIALVALSGSLVYMTRERNRAQLAEALAEKRAAQVEAEATKVNAINRFFNRMLVEAVPGKAGQDARVVDVLERAAANVQTELAGQPEIQAALENTIGTVYIGLGMYSEAEPYLHSALDIRRVVLGRGHQDTLVSSTNLARVYEKQGRWSDAEALLRETLEARRGEFGPEHVRVLDSMNNVASVLQKQGKLAEAEELWSEALETARRVLAEENGTRLLITSNLAQLLKKMNRAGEAEGLLRETLALETKVLGDAHPHTLATKSNLALTLNSLGNSGEAEVLLRNVLAVRLKTLGEDHPDVHVTMSNLSRVLCDSGRLEEGEPLAVQALEGYRRTLGPDNTRTLGALNNLASLLVDLKRAAEAEPLFVELLQRSKQRIPGNHWMMKAFERNYGRCLGQMGRFEEAEELLLEAHSGLKVTLGDENTQTKKAAGYLRELYVAWGKEERASEYPAEDGAHN